MANSMFTYQDQTGDEIVAPTSAPTNPAVPQSGMPQSKASPQAPTIGNMAMGAASAAGAAGNEIADQVAQGANNVFAQKVAAFEEAHKNWLDPNYNVDPDIDKLLDQLPSEKDKLYDSSLSGVAGHGAGAVMDPIGGISAAIARGAGDNAAARRIEYASSEGAKGAGIGFASGFASGGWLGAVIGGVSGIVSGFFGYDAAEKADAERAKAVRSQLQAELRDYNENKRKSRILNKAQVEQSIIDTRKQETAETAKGLLSKKQAFLALLNGVSQNKPLCGSSSSPPSS